MQKCNINQPYIFVCYSAERADQVKPILEQLQDGGYNIWDYKNHMGKGKGFVHILLCRLNQSALLLVFDDNTYGSNAWEQEVLSYAAGIGRKCFLAELEPVNNPKNPSIMRKDAEVVFDCYHQNAIAAFYDNLNQYEAAQKCKNLMAEQRGESVDSGAEQREEPVDFGVEQRGESADSDMERILKLRELIQRYQRVILQTLVEELIVPQLKKKNEEGDWKQELFSLCKKNMNNPNLSVGATSTYKKFYNRAREKGIGNISVTDMDVTFANAILSYEFRSIYLENRKDYFAWIRTIREDRNRFSHDTGVMTDREKEDMVLFELQCLSHIQDFVTFIFNAHENEMPVWDRFQKSSQDKLLECKNNAKKLQYGMIRF